MAHLNIFRLTESKNLTGKFKTICQHCGTKQMANEINYSLTYVKCKFCKKEGSLVIS